MTRGGRRPGAGRPPGSGKHGEPTEPIRLPERLKNDEQIDGIVKVSRHLREIEQDFPWLARKLPELLKLSQNQEKKVVHLSDTKKKTNQPSIYRKQLMPVAATFNPGTSFSDFDDSNYDEVDLALEFGDPGVTVIITVEGESMIDAGIEPGDELVVERINYPMRIPNYGDLVIASLNGEATVKEFRKVNNKAFLVPHNKELEKIEITEDDKFHVYGIVRKLIRSFRKR